MYNVKLNGNLKLIEKIKITVVGSGYVGMSLSVLLSQYNDVTVLDIDPKRVETINNNKSTIADNEIELFLAEKDLCIKATLDKKVAYQDAKFIIVATPTNYDTETNSFDTASVDTVVKDALSENSNALIVIKSTIPVGHTKSLQDRYGTDRVIFSPEFLREGQALKDNLYPSRIIVGSSCEMAVQFSNLLQQAAIKTNLNKIFMNSSEAEAVKLFANTYLAMRVSFFNELDSYALAFDLDARSIVDGVCLDERIGDGYNNPSFGYGGYCLPKDTKQLLANYEHVPQNLIKAVVDSNSTRMDFLANEIIKQNPQKIGVFRLVMKHDSDNFRFSAIQGLMKNISNKGIEILIYEPTIMSDTFNSYQVVNNLEEFKSITDIILANRISNDLDDVAFKVFSRDLYQKN
jgi:UDPglucose 6-dehydrogenase